MLLERALTCQGIAIGSFLSVLLWPRCWLSARFSSQSASWDIDFGRPFKSELGVFGCSDGVKELTFTVTEDGPIADVDVRLAIRQENAYEIFARLVSPSGKEAILVKYQNAEVPGENGKHFQDTYLDDEADDSINSGFAPFAGTEHPGGQRYRLPEGSLGVFDGENARGVWKLQVADNRCFARTGAVNGIIKRGQRTDVPGWMNALAPSLFQLRSFTSSSSKLRRSEFRAISEKY